jgi:hypothetical protein
LLPPLLLLHAVIVAITLESGFCCCSCFWWISVSDLQQAYVFHEKKDLIPDFGLCFVLFCFVLLFSVGGCSCTP